MSETLVTELLRYCKTRYGIDLNRCSGPRDLLAAELGMLKCLVAAGRAAMQRWCEQLGDGYVGARATRGEVRYRFVGKRQKTIHGLFGLITLVRAYYAPLGGSGKGWVPLADQLGIGGGYTPGCQYFMARFCAEHSYQQGLQQFHEVLRPDGRELVSMNKAFEMVRAVADGLQEQRQREIAERADEPVAAREKITGAMVVGIDAGKLAVRANERVTEDGKKSYDRVFRDSKVQALAQPAAQGVRGRRNQGIAGLARQWPLQQAAVLRPPGRDQLLHGQPAAHGLPAVSVVRSADRHK